MKLIEEKMVLKYLVLDDSYFTKVFPYLSDKLFSESYTKKIFSCIREYNEKYNRKPNPEVIALYVEQAKGVSASDYAEMNGIIEYISTAEEYNLTWLLDKTQEFVVNRSYFDALADAADKYEKGTLDSELPEKLNDALSITFDSDIGMCFDEAEKRWELMQTQEDKIPFLVETLNDVTRGGVTRKTLNCLQSAMTGGFKSGTMCSLSCDYLRLGYNVLYLSFEMSESMIMERIDANMCDTEIDNLVKLPKNVFVQNVQKLKEKTFGRFFVKQFPTSMCHVGHIRSLLKELKLKKSFIPDVICFDYLGIMTSMRYKDAAEHIVLKAACEEVRGLCVEYNVVGWTGMQSNREGSAAGVDLNISNISSSHGTTYGFDSLFGLVSTPEFDRDKKILWKQFKNRYADQNVRPTFYLGLNKAKMKVFDRPDANVIDSEITATDEVVKNMNDATNAHFQSISSSSRKRFNFSDIKV